MSLTKSCKEVCLASRLPEIHSNLGLSHRLIGHTVTALLRDPASLQAKNGLTVVKGSDPHTTSINVLAKQLLGTPLNKSDVDNAFDATPSDPPTAVIITLSSTRTSDNPWAAPLAPPRMMADSNAKVVAAMKERGLRKIVTLQALGVGESWPNLIFIMRWIVKGSNLGLSYEDHNLVDKEVRASGLDYVMVRPTRLTEGEAKPVKTFGNTGKGVGSGISKKSVAVFLVDAVEKNTWDKTAPVISN